MFSGAPRSVQPRMERCGRPPLLLLLGVLLRFCSAVIDDRLVSDRHAVYWNSSNPRFSGGEYTVEVAINDYLDIYCPFYAAAAARPETYVLFMVNYDGYTRCDHRRAGFKRWECNRPQGAAGTPGQTGTPGHAGTQGHTGTQGQTGTPGAAGPLKFSEKFQLFTPFSLGFEFRPGHEYYYISSPPPDLQRCLRLKIYVRPTNDSVYESPEPFLTDDTTAGGGGVAKPRPPLLAAMLLAVLLVIASS